MMVSDSQLVVNTHNTIAPTEQYSSPPCVGAILVTRMNKQGGENT